MTITRRCRRQRC